MSDLIDDDFDDDFDDDAPTQTGVTLKLAVIQKRCSELIDNSEDELGGLSLAEDDAAPAADEPDPYDPYGRG